MKVLALDISTKAGYALLDGEKGSVPKILESGKICLGKTAHAFGPYPNSYLIAAQNMGELLLKNVKQMGESFGIDVVVVEETNLGKNRYSQKLLEFIHANFLSCMQRERSGYTICYISSSKWRQAMGLEMSKEDKKNNKALKKLKEADGGATHEAKAAAGIKGKVSKKHLAVRKANELWGLSLKMKDNDVADALLLGSGYLMGAEICDGT